MQSRGGVLANLFKVPVGVVAEGTHSQRRWYVVVAEEKTLSGL
jgi:hypothetical protein